VSPAAAYLALTKPRLLPLVLFSGLPALWLAHGGWPEAGLLAATLLGTALAAGAANALNSYLERAPDARMERTRTRPLPSGALAPRNALVFALLLGGAGTALLWVHASPAAALIALAAILFYVFAYTLWLKPRTPWAVVLGGLSGAIAPLIADAADDGRVGAAGLVLFAIVFAWQPPHFYAITLYRAADYARAGFPTLAARIGAPRTRARILAWTLALVATTLVAVPATRLGALYAVAAAALGAWFAWRATALVRAASDAEARRFFLASLAYLFGLFGAMIGDLAAQALLA
jgi:protoheme IX farnesyltransferase